VRIRCKGEVDTIDRSGVFGAHKGAAPLWFFLRETALTAPGDHIRRLTENLGADEAIPRLHALTARIADALIYEAGRTDAATSAEAALAAGRGVCQDHAHVFVAAARRLGFPSRYVSGYLSTRAGEPMRASHAWGEAHVDGLGWVGFDPANRQSPDGRYVRLATGLDYRDAAPVSGLRFGAGGEALTVSLQIQQQ
jgi:transglutaminase-like putative cysteine protease